jgi:hypothetical protein
MRGAKAFDAAWKKIAMPTPIKTLFAVLIISVVYRLCQTLQDKGLVSKQYGRLLTPAIRF